MSPRRPKLSTSCAGRLRFIIASQAVTGLDTSHTCLLGGTENEQERGVLTLASGMAEQMGAPPYQPLLYLKFGRL